MSVAGNILHDSTQEVYVCERCHEKVVYFDGNETPKSHDLSREAFTKYFFTTVVFGRFLEFHLILIVYLQIFLNFGQRVL